ncbi:uncharacterized protein LOC117174628 [Belonocnema kinseyi]|uniref:uncharacterized protein LOC117174628 n=1 Tax=Belonocnema kinseyi TaxID=2817044 RepID=UPI00143DC64F|nr:uncharacterized protein LOC117174628 [Belonocnema kinseyi]
MTVFADSFADGMLPSQETLTTQLTEVRRKAYIGVENAAQSVKIKDMNWEKIVARCKSTDFNQRFENSIETKYKKSEECYHNAKTPEDIQNADNCCKKLIAALKNEAKLYHAQAQTCIAKCAQDSNNCGQDIPNKGNKKLKE